MASSTSDYPTKSSNSADKPHPPAPIRVHKRRTRANKKVPTMILPADASNFRAMVQQLTGFPAPNSASAVGGGGQLQSSSLSSVVQWPSSIAAGPFFHFNANTSSLLPNTLDTSASFLPSSSNSSSSSAAHHQNHHHNSFMPLLNHPSPAAPAPHNYLPTTTKIAPFQNVPSLLHNNTHHDQQQQQPTMNSLQQHNAYSGLLQQGTDQEGASAMAEGAAAATHSPAYESYSAMAAAEDMQSKMAFNSIDAWLAFDGGHASNVELTRTV